MRGIKLSDCSPELRARIEAAMVTGARIAPVAPEDAGRAKTGGNASGRNTQTVEVKSRAPNKTESEYNRTYLRGEGLYEAITLRLPGGSRYTPDWVLFGDNGSVELHEVKGGYRLGSHGRALTAFREAVAAFPFFEFVWAVRKGPGDWDVRKHKGGR